jgi:hypothetical protein
MSLGQGGFGQQGFERLAAGDESFAEEFKSDGRRMWLPRREL